MREDGEDFSAREIYHYGGWLMLAAGVAIVHFGRILPLDVLGGAVGTFGALAALVTMRIGSCLDLMFGGWPFGN